MKKILVLTTLLVLIFSLNSCSKDDDREPTAQELLEGTWLIINHTFLGWELSLDDPCDRDENIVIDRNGNALWKYSLSDDVSCLENSRDITIKAITKNHDFEIESFNNNISYKGRFIKEDVIEIQQDISDAIGTFRAVYEFGKVE